LTKPCKGSAGAKGRSPKQLQGQGSLGVWLSATVVVSSIVAREGARAGAV